MGLSKSTLALCLAAVLLCFFIILDDTDKRQLWDSSADFQHDIQSDSTAAKGFFEFIEQASLVVTAAVQAFYYYGGAPALGLNLIVANALGYYLPGVLKMMYSDPRPYWEYDRVQGISCASGWGNPSGHALYTGSVWLSLCFSLVIWRKALWVPLVVLWLLLVGFDRAYLGAHFYSQVLLGWFFGLYIAAIHGKMHSSEALWFSSSRRLLALLAFHAVIAVLIVLGILLFELRDPHWDAAWALRIKAECSKSYSVSDAKEESFIESAMLTFVPGAFLGATLQRTLTEECKRLIWWKRAILIVASFIPLIIQGAALLIAKSKLTSSAWGAWVFVLIISYLSGLLFTAGVPQLAWLFFLRKQARHPVNDEDDLSEGQSKR